MRLALITGGTSGIGLAFARALAGEGSDLVLVARDPDRLDAVATDLAAAHGVRVERLVADLSERAGQQLVVDRLAAGDVDVLVNNAGFSLKTPIVGGDDALADRAYEVMGRAPRVLAAAAAPGMVARAASTSSATSTGSPNDASTSAPLIITVASVSALTRQDAYSALKAYALALTEALALELAGSGVHVTAVLPGWTRTEFHARGRSGRSKVPGVLWLSADRVAAEALRDARAGRVISIPSTRYRILAGALGVLPDWAVRAVSHRIRGARSHAAEGGHR